MITHLGKRDDDEKKNTHRLYVLQHEHEQETSLLEVPCRIESLRRSVVCILVTSLPVCETVIAICKTIIVVCIPHQFTLSVLVEEYLS